MEAPPPIPYRSRQHSRRKSLQGPSAHASNRVHIQPASPEVISSLITSLSVISSPANELFESHSTPVSPSASTTSFGNTYNGNRGSGGSFGIDYGAFKQPSLRQLIEEESLDELAASPPVIKTAKPPSGFSPLTAPKSPTKDTSSLKSFLRSRPGSKGSAGSKDKDDSCTIGSLSIEPGVAPAPELRRKRSTDSWDKKQARGHKGLMYMSSKERLREKDLEKKRGSGGTGGGNSKVFGLDRLTTQGFDTQSFMAETPITEEPPSTGEQPKQLKLDTANMPLITNRYSPSIANSPGGIGSGRFIPARDSSLRKPAAQTKKRDSLRASRQLEKELENEKHTGEDAQKRSVAQQEKAPDTTESPHLKVPLEGPEPPLTPTATTLASKQLSEVAKLHEHVLVEDDYDDAAPPPTITQRRERLSPSPDRATRSLSQKRQSGTTDQAEPKLKRSSSRLKRLSAPLSPRHLETDSPSKSNPRPASTVGHSEPARTSEIFVDGRPTSADSIDDAVEAYLASPRLSQKIRHPQTGRTISFSEVGDPEGFAVFCCVGMGLTRYLTAFYDELALTLRLRLITPDRPGVGESEPYTDGTATPLSWPGEFYPIIRSMIANKL
jgi:hypothetical protein